MATCTILFVVISLVSFTWGQIAVDHVGNIEDTVDGYRIQYHDEINLLMIINALDCFVVDLVRGSPLANKLEDPNTRMSTQRSILALIKAGNVKSASLGDLMEHYHDVLLRALCFRAEVYTVDVSSLQHSHQ